MSKSSREDITEVVVGCVLVLLAIILCYYQLPSRRIRRRPKFDAAHPGLQHSGPSAKEYHGESVRLEIGHARYQHGELKVREVIPDPIAAQVWLPVLFQKVCVRLKAIQDDLELF